MAKKIIAIAIMAIMALSVFGFRVFKKAVLPKVKHTFLLGATKSSLRI